jgi:hypothetical protein
MTPTGVRMNLADVDRLLTDASELGGSTPAPRVREVRDDLARVAVYLSYARHVLSVDLGVLRTAPDETGDLQSLVDDLPRVLTESSIGGGWSLSSDSPVTLAAANQALSGQADGLLTAHVAMAGTAFSTPEELERAIAAIDEQLTQLSERRDKVEQTLRDVQGLIIGQYKTGSATVDDWLD